MSFISEVLQAAMEATTVEVEKEYSYFVHVTDEQLQTLLQRGEGLHIQLFDEITFPFIKGAPKPRLRYYSKVGKLRSDEGLVDVKEPYEFTAKKKGDAGSLEHNTAISAIQYEALEPLGSSKTSRMRISVPVMQNDAPIVRQNGSELAWEIDIYIDAQRRTWSNWIKVELEVDDFKYPNVAGAIPFDYETLIVSSTEEESERNIIQNLYDHVYNLKSV